MRPRCVISLVSSAYTHTRKINSYFKSSVLIFTTRNMSSATKLPKVFVTRKVPEDGIKYLRNKAEVTQWNSDDAIPRGELKERVRGVDGLFCLLTDKIDAEILDCAGPSLKAVSTMSVGYDHVDVGECNKRGIPVGFTPNVLTSATAELTVTLLLTVSRRIKEGIEAVKDGSWGTWKPLWLCGQGLDGATVGVIGLGRIGFAVAQRLKPFGVAKILYADAEEKEYANQLPAEYANLDQLLEESDFVLGCCALTEENVGLMNSSAFKKMKKTAIFINTSRGGLANQDDLYQALKSGEILGAGLDVTTPEPLPTDHPLLSLDNCVILPHIASATLKSRNAMSELCARNIIEALNGNSMPAEVK
ncbi:glyoxylate reductase/hydroxypyruvate reductase-like [Mercenaria mercenaria]|uniref:glyoxylate reductase/hydroxypyruvate reductase-like n=1 Tax=Mercenaria mercenaria TaxID=6596 RepID=UPI00234E37F6|nr:glyoxylate reductase/hydroxypyruvate reductase-like [Mercenaria mercenaria]